MCCNHCRLLGFALWIVFGPLATAQHRPPLEGPLTWIALSVTDDAAFDVNEFEVLPRAGLAGDPLPAATEDHVLAVLDSGASVHLVSYPDAEDLGIDAAH